MKTDNNIQELTSWIREVKALNNYSYDFLGELINISGAGFKKALDKSTITLERFKVISNKLGLEDEFNSIISNSPNLKKNSNILNSFNMNDDLKRRIEVLEVTIDGLKERLKMVYDQLLLLQRNWIVDKEKNKDENKSM